MMDSYERLLVLTEPARTFSAAGGIPVQGKGGWLLEASSV